MKYYKTFNTKTTLKIGEIVPVFTTFLQPDTDLKFTQKALSRLITPLNPTMDQPIIDYYTFAITPNALFGPDVWSNYLKVFLEKQLKTNVDIFKSSISVNYYEEHSADFECKITQPTSFVHSTETTHNDAWEWRSRLQECTTFLNALGVSFENAFVASEQQINSQPELKFTFSFNKALPLFYQQIYYYFFRDTLFNLYERPTYDKFAKLIVSDVDLQGSKDYLNLKTALALPNKWNSARPFTIDNTDSLNSPNNLNTFRQTERYYLELLEKDPQNYGDVLTFFNGQVKDPLAPRLIAHKRVIQNIRAVEATASNREDSSFIGDYGANSTIYENWDSSFKANDFTFIMTVAVARYYESYYNVPNPLLGVSNSKLLEYMEKNIYVKEKNNEPYKPLFLADFKQRISLNDSELDSVYGFQEPYYDLRHGFNFIGNKMLNDDYENWHYSINSASADDKITPNMRECKRAAVSRTLSYHEYELILEFQTDIVETNHISYYNTALDTEPTE